MNFIMILFSLILNFLFLNFNNPLIMSIILILQTIMLNLIMGKIYFTFWFSYVLFLIFIGGLFILFIYIISMIYNNILFFKKMKYSLMLSVMLFFFMMFNTYWTNYFFFNYETLINNMNNFLKENNLNMIKFFNFPNNLINLMMILYLFFMLIIVVKITNFLKGPIRTIN